jgi:hypothetical protein
MENRNTSKDLITDLLSDKLKFYSFTRMTQETFGDLLRNVQDGKKEMTTTVVQRYIKGVVTNSLVRIFMKFHFTEFRK